MQNDKDILEKNHSLDTSEKELRIIFSPEEVKSTVKGFVLSWLKGRIRITFTTAEHIMEVGKRSGIKIDFEEALLAERTRKRQFIDLISICSGAKSVTPEEEEKAINELFYAILTFRAGGRIEGKFEEYDLEESLRKIEEDLKITNDLVEQLIALHREEIGI